MLGFSEGGEVSGVNMTVGLPIVRTSVDHGTAFDIAGEGIASPRSMEDAIEVATTAVRKPASTWHSGGMNSDSTKPPRGPGRTARPPNKTPSSTEFADRLGGLVEGGAFDRREFPFDDLPDTVLRESDGN